MKTNKETRRIDTCMYGQAAFDVLSNLGFGKYCWFIDVRRDVDDMVYFEVSDKKIPNPSRDFPQNPFVGLDSRRSLLWIASRLKREVAQWAEYQKWKDGWWREKNDEKLGWLTPDTTVSDAYAVHACLSGKKPRSAEIGGKAAPRETVEDRKAKAEAKAAARAEYMKEIAKLRAEREKFEKALNAKRDAVWKKFYNKVFEIDPDDKSYAFAATSEDVQAEIE